MGENIEMISVIIPVYNVEKYLKKCLDSVMNQTYQELEIILINDGSTDSSREICLQYVNMDVRIRLIEEENQGLSAARNLGIENATGEYITFIDSDDFVDGNMLEILYQSIKDCSADVAMCDFLNVYEDKSIRNKFNKKRIAIEILPEGFLHYINRNFSALVNAWGKLYKRKIFNKIRYPKGKLHEDEFVLYKWLFQCKKIVYVRDKLYYYLQRADGIMGKYRLQNVRDIVEARSGHLNYAIEKKDIELYRVTQARMTCAMAVAYKRLSEAADTEGLDWVYEMFHSLYQKEGLNKLLSLDERIGFFLLNCYPKLYIRAVALYRRLRK